MIESEPGRLARIFYEEACKQAPSYIKQALNQENLPLWEDLLRDRPELRRFITICRVVLAAMRPRPVSRSFILSDLTGFNVGYEAALEDYTLNLRFKKVLEVISNPTEAPSAPGVVLITRSKLDWLISAYQRALAEEEDRRHERQPHDREEGSRYVYE